MSSRMHTKAIEPVHRSFFDLHLKMIGSSRRIVKSPTASVSFGNLLLDLSKLATLLVPYYSDINGLAGIYVQQLYDSTIYPPVSETSSKSTQDLFIKFPYITSCAMLATS